MCCHQIWLQDAKCVSCQTTWLKHASLVLLCVGKLFEACSAVLMRLELQVCCLVRQNFEHVVTVMSSCSFMSDWFDFPVAFQAQAWYCAVNPKPDLEMAGQGKGKGSGSGSGSGKGKGKGKGDDAPGTAPRLL